MRAILRHCGLHSSVIAGLTRNPWFDEMPGQARHDVVQYDEGESGRSLNTTPPFDVRSFSVLKRQNSGERAALVRTCFGAAAALLVVVTALTGIINKTIDY